MKICYRFFFLFACLLTVAIGCNRKNHEVDNTLDRANALMTEHPDSALSLIERIDTSGLDRARMARYGLFLTKAQDKNYIVPESDSLILKAVNFYRGRDNDEEVQSLYYYGYFFYYKDSVENAFIYLHLANDLAKEHKNYFYEGLSERALSSLYGRQYIFDKYLSLGKEAQKSFVKYENELNDGSRKYSGWMDIMIADAYNSLKQPQKALEISNNPDSTIYNTDSYFRNRTLQNRAQSYHLLEKYDKAIEQYKIMRQEGFKFTGDDWCSLSHDLYNSGNRVLAYATLDSARIHVSTVAEELYLKWLDSYYTSYAGDYKNAYEKMRKLEYLSRSNADSYLHKPATLVMIDSYKSQTKVQKDLVKSERSKNTLLVIVITSIAFLVITLILYYRSRIKNKQLKIDVLEANEEKMQTKLNALSDEFELLEENIRLKNTDKKILSDSLKSSLKKRFKDLEDVCVSIFKTPTHALNIDALPDWAQKQYNRIRSESSLSSYDSMIDIYSEGYMDYVIGLFPNVRTDKIRLIRYLYVGFSIDMILFLLGKKSRDWVDKTKYSIKMTILSKVDRATAADILHQLRIKP